MPKTGLSRKTAEGRAALSALANAAKATKVISPETKAARSAAHSAQLKERHAHTSPEQKAATAEKRRLSLLAYWETRKGIPDASRSTKISEAQKRAYAGFTPQQKAERRDLLIKANLLSNAKPHRKLTTEEKKAADEKRIKYWTEDARNAQATHSRLVASRRSPKETALITTKRAASYASRSEKDKAATAEKIRRAQSNRTPDEKAALLEKQHATKRSNGTFNTSREEDKAYELLCRYFDPARVHRNFRSPAYPYACDFVIRLTKKKSRIEDALFIECNFHWTHGAEPFDTTNSEHAKRLREWKVKAKTSSYFKAGVSVWTTRDVEKRELARKTSLSWFEFFKFNELENFLERAHHTPKLAAAYSDSALLRAVNRIAGKAPRYINEFTFNFMPHFYQKEMALWGDKVSRFRLLANREKYLHKKAATLTDQELLSGFRKSGLTHREHFSHFPVCLVKQFVDLVDPQSVYDPFLGWGHRMVGFAALNVKYTGNDLWDKSYQGGSRIAAWLKEHWPGAQCEVSLGDAANTRPGSSHDAVFTCPPYPLGAEVYGSPAGAEHLSLPGYWEWWKRVVNASITSSTKSFGLIVPSRWEQEFSQPITRKGFVLVSTARMLPNGRTASHLNVKKNFEVFLTWRRV